MFTPPQSIDYEIITEPLWRINKKSYDKIVAYIGPIERSSLKHFSDRFRWLQLPSHGANGFDDHTLYKNPDVWVSCLKGVYSEAIAQYCITSYYVFNTFSFRKRSKSFHIEYCKIVGKVKILIIGLGNIGEELAKQSKTIGWTVYGVKRNIIGYQSNYVDALYSMNEISTVLPKVDYVVNLLPENASTTNIYDYDFFSKMRPNALFCNVGRKSAVVDKDLIRAVNSRVIRGAILDVHYNIDYGSDNILLTGHNSSVSSRSQELLKDYYYNQLSEFLNGGKPKNTIQIR